MLATGGTYSALKDAGVEVKSLGEAMGLSEALSGRVKTLHSNLFAGILAKRDDEGHMRELKAMGVSPIDMVVCNFYPFEKVAEGPERDRRDDDREHRHRRAFDGQGVDEELPLRHRGPVARFYAPVLEELSKRGGKVGLELRRSLAVEAFAITASYDAAIYNELQAEVRFEGVIPRQVRPLGLQVPGREIRGEPGPEGGDILHRRRPRA